MSITTSTCTGAHFQERGTQHQSQLKDFWLGATLLSFKKNICPLKDPTKTSHVYLRDGKALVHLADPDYLKVKKKKTIQISFTSNVPLSSTQEICFQELIRSIILPASMIHILPWLFQ